MYAAPVAACDCLSCKRGCANEDHGMPGPVTDEESGAVPAASLRRDRSEAQRGDHFSH